MLTSIFDAPKVTTITEQATMPQSQMPAGAGERSTILSLPAQKLLIDISDSRLQRATNILQSVAALIAIIYFVNSLLKK